MANVALLDDIPYADWLSVMFRVLVALAQWASCPPTVADKISANRFHHLYLIKYSSKRGTELLSRLHVRVTCLPLSRQLLGAVTLPSAHLASERGPSTLVDGP